MAKKIKMAWEWNWPSLTWHYGMFTWFDASLQTSLSKLDHSPSFSCHLALLGIKLLDFGYYNIYHEEHVDDDSEWPEVK